MSLINSFPVIAQVKSFVQFVSGDSEGARATQKDFLLRNTFPVSSQLCSLYHATKGDNASAREVQKSFLSDMMMVTDSVPILGHAKGVIHYALGDKEGGHEAMKAASRSIGVIAGGVGGFVVGGPVGASAGGIAGGAGMDIVISGSEKLINKEDAKTHGYVSMYKELTSSKCRPGPGQVFDMALQPIFDGLTGYVSGKAIASRLGAGKASAAQAAEGNVPSNRLGLDKAALDNRANQLNTNHIKTGPGRPAGYHGDSSLAALNNHANQLNPNNANFQGAAPRSVGANPAMPSPAPQGNPTNIRVLPAPKLIHEEEIGVHVNPHENYVLFRNIFPDNRRANL